MDTTPDILHTLWESLMGKRANIARTRAANEQAADLAARDAIARRVHMSPDALAREDAALAVYEFDAARRKLTYLAMQAGAVLLVVAWVWMNFIAAVCVVVAWGLLVNWFLSTRQRPSGVPEQPAQPQQFAVHPPQIPVQRAVPHGRHARPE